MERWGIRLVKAGVIGAYGSLGVGVIAYGRHAGLSWFVKSLGLSLIAGRVPQSFSELYDHWKCPSCRKRKIVYLEWAGMLTSVLLYRRFSGRIDRWLNAVEASSTLPGIFSGKAFLGSAVLSIGVVAGGIALVRKGHQASPRDNSV